LLSSAQAKKVVNYVESDNEDDEVLKPLFTNGPSTRPSKRRKFTLEDSDDEFEVDAAMEEAMVEVGTSFGLLLAPVRISSDHAQQILMTSSFLTIRKTMHHGLRNGKGRHLQMSPNKHRVRRPSRT